MERKTQLFFGFSSAIRTNHELRKLLLFFFHISYLTYYLLRPPILLLPTTKKERKKKITIKQQIKTKQNKKTKNKSKINWFFETHFFSQTYDVVVLHNIFCDVMLVNFFVFPFHADYFDSPYLLPFVTQFHEQ